MNAAVPVYIIQVLVQALFASKEFVTVRTVVMFATVGVMLFKSVQARKIFVAIIAHKVLG